VQQVYEHYTVAGLSIGAIVTLRPQVYGGSRAT
jgi:hypothetical protein